MRVSQGYRSMAVVAVLAVFCSGLPAEAGGLVATTQNVIRGTVTYETGFDHEDYNTIRESYPMIPTRPWGEHPIIWKHIINPGLAFDAFATGSLFGGVPSMTRPEIGDSALLNAYEASGAFTQGGATVDPTGHWVETLSFEGEEVAVLAAIAIWKWNTPVYINFGYQSPDPAEYFGYGGVIDSVTLSVPSGVPHEVCGWDQPDPPTTCPGLVIESVKMTHYTDFPFEDPVQQYNDSPPFSGADFVSIYESSFWFSDGTVIYDPPVTGAGVVAHQLVVSTSRAQAAGSLVRGTDGSLSASLQD